MTGFMDRYRRVIVAFDVDGTLIDENDEPREDVIAILRSLVPWCVVVVWSGSGLAYARTVGRRLKLPTGVVYWVKGGKVDITFDDQTITTMGTVNIKVGK